ncbi:methyltransferase domain-containing protein [Phycicoccus sp. MAQZ13P-2]|uniref:class I SAM-dependent methyltransferase n=1 Tax=Phycicoccus mangrovi TaxID=2840470 RepID=UPI001BFFFF7C|nr:class I SAM-dependent methyltransferase [Phycicoccus mangrovi]MBT9256639.1 methyltransferase domain-containing protein [Phycicoccus mangrovi]MBT9274797.1 methyltransferase domain-containing protein [Phycicoccus mangrovi]
MTTHKAHRHGETPGHPDHGPGEPDPAHGRTLRDDESAWDARYAELDRVWSGEPNHALTVEAATLSPARALDVGCGEGADAVWLATRGWTVTALDPSGVALARARAAAEASGVLVDWVHAGLAEADLPVGGFDLVSVFYPALDLETGPVERLASLVAPGGTLVVVHHADVDRERAIEHGFDPDLLLSPAGVAAGLGEGWDVVGPERRPRSISGGSGAHHHDDLVVRATRRP